MALTPNMNLNLPVPTVTLGPLWASQLNTALSLVDDHDHTPGKGKSIPALALNINQDLSFQGNNLNLVKSVRFVSQPGALAGPSDISSVYVVNGDLFYNNGSGTAVQVTDGSVVNATSDGISRAYELIDVTASTLSISPSDTFSFLAADSTANAITITLPAANSVAPGRFYEVKDAANLAATNNITVETNGADTINDGGDELVMDVDGQFISFTSDGVSNWFTNKLIPEPDSVTTASIQDGAVTPDKLSAKNIQISSSCGVWQSPLASNTWYDVTNLSVSITSTGRPLVIMLINDGSGNDAYLSGAGGGENKSFRFLRDSTPLGVDILGDVAVSTGGINTAVQSRLPVSSLTQIDIPSAGTYVYKLQTFSQTLGAFGPFPEPIVRYAKLVVYEL